MATIAPLVAGVETAVTEVKTEVELVAQFFGERVVPFGAADFVALDEGVSGARSGNGFMCIHVFVNDLTKCVADNLRVEQAARERAAREEATR